MQDLYNLFNNILSNDFNYKNENIKDITFLGGLTNKNYKVTTENYTFVLRIPGNGTSDLINRKHEKKNCTFANKLGLDSDIVYFNSESGVKVSKYINNSQELSPSICKEPFIMEKVASLFKTLHNSSNKMENSFSSLDKLNEYEDLLISNKGEFPPNYSEIKTKVLKLNSALYKFMLNCCPCHNDALSANFILNDKGKLYLIDWEYAGMNDPFWDLTSYILENELNTSQEDTFLKLYFESSTISKQYKLKIHIYKILQDFLWSIWAKFKEAHGDDLGEYALFRYNRALSNIDKLSEYEDML